MISEKLKDSTEKVSFKKLKNQLIKIILQYLNPYEKLNVATVNRKFLGILSYQKDYLTAFKIFIRLLSLEGEFNVFNKVSKLMNTDKNDLVIEAYADAIFYLQSKNKRLPFSFKSEHEIQEIYLYKLVLELGKRNIVININEFLINKLSFLTCNDSFSKVHNQLLVKNFYLSNLSYIKFFSNILENEVNNLSQICFKNVTFDESFSFKVDEKLIYTMLLSLKPHIISKLEFKYDFEYDFDFEFISKLFAYLSEFPYKFLLKEINFNVKLSFSTKLLNLLKFISENFKLEKINLTLYLSRFNLEKVNSLLSFNLSKKVDLSIIFDAKNDSKLQEIMNSLENSNFNVTYIIDDLSHKSEDSLIYKTKYYTKLIINKLSINFILEKKDFQYFKISNLIHLDICFRSTLKEDECSQILQIIAENSLNLKSFVFDLYNNNKNYGEDFSLLKLPRKLIDTIKFYLHIDNICHFAYNEKCDKSIYQILFNLLFNNRDKDLYISCQIFPVLNLISDKISLLYQLFKQKQLSNVELLPNNLFCNLKYVEATSFKNDKIYSQPLRKAFNSSVISMKINNLLDLNVEAYLEEKNRLNVLCLKDDNIPGNKILEYLIYKYKFFSKVRSLTIMVTSVNNKNGSFTSLLTELLKTLPNIMVFSLKIRILDKDFKEEFISFSRKLDNVTLDLKN